jgi:hypothetical protein
MWRGDDDDEVFIEGDPDEEFPFSPPSVVLQPSGPSVIAPSVHSCAAILPTFKFEALSFLRFRIFFPSLVLPFSLAVVNQFDRDPVLLELTVDLLDNSFK